MKKLLIIFYILIVAVGCEEVEFNLHNENGYISGMVLYYHLNPDHIELNEHISQAVIELWYQETSENGSPDYVVTADDFGKFYFDHLKNGIYFIKASGKDSQEIIRSGSDLIEVTVFNSDLILEIKVE